MVNSWSLLYDEMYGPDDEERDVKNKKENETKSEYWFDYNRNDPNRSDPFKESISFEGPADWSKNEESWESIEEPLNINFPIPGNAAADTIAFTGSHLPGAMGAKVIVLPPMCCYITWETKDLTWYPDNVVVLKQMEYNSWDKTIDKLYEMMENWEW